MRTPDSSWVHALGPLINTGTVCKILRLQPIDIASKLAVGSVIGIRSVNGGPAWFPEWQFDADTGQIRKGVAEVIEVFRKELLAVDGLRDVDVVVGTWSYTPQAGLLDDLSPAEWICGGGDVSVVVRAAEAAALSVSAASVVE